MELPINRNRRADVLTQRSLARFRSGMDQLVQQTMDTMESARHGLDPNDVAVFFRGNNGHLVHKAFLDTRRPVIEQIEMAWESLYKRFPHARGKGSNISFCFE